MNDFSNPQIAYRLCGSLDRNPSRVFPGILARADDLDGPCKRCLTFECSLLLPQRAYLNSNQFALSIACSEISVGWRALYWLSPVKKDWGF
jgi:hypothetical protein